MKDELMALLNPVVPQFKIEGELIDADQIFRGHINKTYVTTVSLNGTNRRYVHQWINDSIFGDPPKLMENISKVVQHVGNKRPGQLNLVPQADGKSFLRDDEGHYWRTYDFVEGTTVFDVVECPTVAYEAAVTFGNFLSDLSDLDAKDFHITIPDFHNTPKRLEQLREAMAVASPERLESAKDLLGFVSSVEWISDKLTKILDEYPEAVRVTHNDTKVNNVLFDSESGKGKCVIDLDTVMPGTVLFDIGDLIRTACNKAAEDEKNLDLVIFDSSRFEAIVKGFGETVGKTLIPAEWDALPYCGAVITFECGTRFLADYLRGDTYFHINYPEHNLDRTKVQFELVRQMLEQIEELKLIAEKSKNLTD